MVFFVYLLFGLVLLAPVTGELFRIPVFGFQAQPTDVLIPVLLAAWALEKLRNDRCLRWGRAGKSALFFLFLLFVSFCFNLFRFDAHEMVVGFAYFLRLGLYFSLLGVAFDLLQRDPKGVFLKIVGFAVASAFLLICVLGFLQLRYFPSFLDLGMELQGWDPHIGRLLSTWFDPNFVGGYLAFVLSVSLALALWLWRERRLAFFWAVLGLAAVGLVALYLTYSRSALLSFLCALLLLALLKSPRLLGGALLCLVLVFGLSSRAQERMSDALDSGRAFLGFDAQQPLDPTSKLRVQSWAWGAQIAADHPWIGIGYNRYQFEINARGHGLLSDHAATGSDSSLLTLWATGGLLSLLGFLATLGVAAATALRRTLGHADFQSFLQAGLLAAVGGLLVHSLFVNSLLYPLIMVYLWTGLGMMDGTSTSQVSRLK